MNLKFYTVLLPAALSLILLSCTHQQEEQKQKVKQPEITETREMPVEMIKSPDGNYYFPNNIHRPKSDKDSLVTVYPSDLK